MKGVHCPTRRAAIATEQEATRYAQRVAKGATARHCHYCGLWHVVGFTSMLEHPSKPTTVRRRSRGTRW